MKKFLITIGLIVTAISACFLWLNFQLLAATLAAVTVLCAIAYTGLQIWLTTRGKLIAQNVQLLEASKLTKDHIALIMPRGGGIIEINNPFARPAMAIAGGAVDLPSTTALAMLPQHINLMQALSGLNLSKSKLELLFGVSEAGPIVKAFGPEVLHIGNVGASGSGKSSEAQSLLFQLALHDPKARRVQFAFVDTEGKTSRPFRHAPHTLLMANEPQEASRVLAQIEELMQFRAKLPEEELDDMPVLAVLLEEFLSLKDELAKADWERLIRIATKARKSKIYLLALAQNFYSSEDTRTIKGQLRTRNAFVLEDSGTYAAFGIKDTNAVNRLLATPHPGRFLHRTASGLTLAQAPYISPETIEAHFDNQHSATRSASASVQSKGEARPGMAQGINSSEPGNRVMGYRDMSSNVSSPQEVYSTSGGQSVDGGEVVTAQYRELPIIPNELAKPYAAYRSGNITAQAMASALGLSSKSTGHSYIVKLRDAGLI